MDISAPTFARRPVRLPRSPWAFSIYKLRDELADRVVPMTGMMAAMIFAAQMVNFQLVVVPVSGHLIGGVLAGLILGPWAGCLAVTMVLVVQRFLFSDGGLFFAGGQHSAHGRHRFDRRLCRRRRRAAILPQSARGNDRGSGDRFVGHGRGGLRPVLSRIPPVAFAARFPVRQSVRPDGGDPFADRDRRGADYGGNRRLRPGPAARFDRDERDRSAPRA